MKKIKFSFGILILSFILIFLLMVADFLDFMSNGYVIFGLWAIFVVSGILLVVFTRSQDKINKSLKRYLFLTGYSASSLILMIFLHNLMYAVGTVFEHIDFIKYLFSGIEVIAFMVAIFVCPITFLIGIIGTSVIFLRKDSKQNKGAGGKTKA